MTKKTGLSQIKNNLTFIMGQLNDGYSINQIYSELVKNNKIQINKVMFYRLIKNHNIIAQHNKLSNQPNAINRQNPILSNSPVAQGATANNRSSINQSPLQTSQIDFSAGEDFLKKHLKPQNKD